MERRVLAYESFNPDVEVTNYELPENLNEEIDLANERINLAFEYYDALERSMDAIAVEGADIYDINKNIALGTESMEKLFDIMGDDSLKNVRSFRLGLESVTDIESRVSIANEGFFEAIKKGISWIWAQIARFFRWVASIFQAIADFFFKQEGNGLENAANAVANSDNKEEKNEVKEAAKQVEKEIQEVTKEKRLEIDKIVGNNKNIQLDQELKDWIDMQFKYYKKYGTKVNHSELKKCVTKVTSYIDKNIQNYSSIINRNSKDALWKFFEYTAIADYIKTLQADVDNMLPRHVDMLKDFANNLIKELNEYGQMNGYILYRTLNFIVFFNHAIKTGILNENVYKTQLTTLATWLQILKNDPESEIRYHIEEAIENAFRVAGIDAFITEYNKMLADYGIPTRQFKNPSPTPKQQQQKQNQATAQANQQQQATPASNQPHPQVAQNLPQSSNYKYINPIVKDDFDHLVNNSGAKQVKEIKRSTLLKILLTSTATKKQPNYAEALIAYCIYTGQVMFDILVNVEKYLTFVNHNLVCSKGVIRKNGRGIETYKFDKNSPNIFNILAQILADIPSKWAVDVGHKQGMSLEEYIKQPPKFQYLKDLITEFFKAIDTWNHKRIEMNYFITSNTNKKIIDFLPIYPKPEGLLGLSTTKSESKFRCIPVNKDIDGPLNFINGEIKVQDSKEVSRADLDNLFSSQNFDSDIDKDISIKTTTNNKDKYFKELKVLKDYINNLASVVQLNGDAMSKLDTYLRDYNHYFKPSTYHNPDVPNNAKDLIDKVLEILSDEVHANKSDSEKLRYRDLVTWMHANMRNSHATVSQALGVLTNFYTNEVDLNKLAKLYNDISSGYLTETNLAKIDIDKINKLNANVKFS